MPLPVVKPPDITSFIFGKRRRKKREEEEYEDVVGVDFADEPFFNDEDGFGQDGEVDIFGRDQLKKEDDVRILTRIVFRNRWGHF